MTMEGLAKVKRPDRLPPDVALEAARSNPVDTAMTILLKAMLGQLAPGTSESQRKAALDILGGAMWETLDDGQLDAHLARVIAEVERRRVKAKP